ncbi:MAG: SPOR domain-containing protein [Azoarcus sp.]|nr:SPOR domain-containing protein [Azoarcus sp.]
MENIVSNVANANFVLAETGQNLYLQLGVFVSRDNAEGFRVRVLERVAGLTGRLELDDEGERFRLFAGPYASLGSARADAERIGELLDIRPFAVWRKKP